MSSVVTPIQEQPSVAHYSPSGAPVDSMVGAKPGIMSKEQYGQPESASLPPNYRSFGSWGLYIGGNPADGYYSNYYKNVDTKPQVSGEPYKMVNQPVFSPIVKQASAIGGDHYPFAYSPSEFHSGVPVHSISSYSSNIGSGVGSPAEGVDSVEVPIAPTGVSSSVQSGVPQGVSSYADFYAMKKLGKDNGKVNPSGVKGSPQQQIKGYSSFVGRTSSVPSYAQPQVVAYSVPVGSQIVGSQPGADGAFSPYGIHAATRYAIKPTVSSTSSYYQGAPVGYENQVAPVVPQGYKPDVYPMAGQPVSYYPMNFYGYPINQISPSVQGSPSVVSSNVVHSPAQGSVMHDMVQPAMAPQAPASPVQVGHAAAVAHGSPGQESQTVQEQVVDKSETDKSSIKQ